jgi:hypothetical protein
MTLRIAFSAEYFYSPKTRFVHFKLDTSQITKARCLVRNATRSDSSTSRNTLRLTARTERHLPTFLNLIFTLH